MSRPAMLLPGDSLCYKSHDLLGNLLTWGQWLDGHENTSYVHVAGVYDTERLIRQNPGGPAFEDLDAQPWDYIDVYRMKPISGFDSDQFSVSLETARIVHWDEGYGYEEFEDYIFSDLEARLGLMRDAVARRKAANRMLARHASVCSVFWGQEVLQDALGAALRQSDFTLFPGMGPGQVRPADFPLSSYLELVT